MARAVKVDVLEVARACGRFVPRGMSVELLPADRSAILQQLADHLIDELQIADADLAERFDGMITSPIYAERVS